MSNSEDTTSPQSNGSDEKELEQKTPSEDQEKTAELEDTTQAEEQSETQEEPSSEREETESGVEEDESAYVDSLAEKLKAADSGKYEALLEKFKSDETFSSEEIAWIKSETSLDEAAVRYGLSLQRHAYKQSLKETEEVSLMTLKRVDEALGGDGTGSGVNSVIAYGFEHGSDSQKSEWETLINFAKRTGDDTIVERVVNEIADFKNNHKLPNRPGPKTLGHLSGSSTPIKAEQAIDASSQAKSPEALYDQTLLSELGRLSDQSLANMFQNRVAHDPKTVAHVRAVLKQRGIVK